MSASGFPSGMRARERKQEAARLLEQVRGLLERLATLQGAEIISLPVVVPTELAALLDDLAQESGVPVPYLYSSCIVLGAWHSAHDNAKHAVARRIAAIFRRHTSKEEWARFVARHPGAAS